MTKGEKITKLMYFISCILLCAFAITGLLGVFHVITNVIVIFLPLIILAGMWFFSILFFLACFFIFDRGE